MRISRRNSHRSIPEIRSAGNYNQQIGRKFYTFTSAISNKFHYILKKKYYAPIFLQILPKPYSSPGSMNLSTIIFNATVTWITEYIYPQQKEFSESLNGKRSRFKNKCIILRNVRHKHETCRNGHRLEINPLIKSRHFILGDHAQFIESHFKHNTQQKLKHTCILAWLHAQ